MMETVSTILRYWFGDKNSASEINDEKKTLWWAKSFDTDQEITDRFEPATRAISCGEFSEWQSTPEGLLASIICVDQFPRNMYRGTPDAFVFDPVALGFANMMIDRGWDQELQPVNRLFCYLPFEHSEALSDQHKAVRLIGAIRDAAAVTEKEIFENFFQFAKRHYEVISQFGRFPHRNEILGRESTQLELEFLEKPGSSF
jgi:uncharacterized protein (DUF924 family)